MGPGINHLAGEWGGWRLEGWRVKKRGLLQTPSESGSSSFALRKASFAETDAMPQLSPDVLCISAAFEHIGGSRLESQALMFTVGTTALMALCREGRWYGCFGGRGMLGLGSTLGMGMAL